MSRLHLLLAVRIVDTVCIFYVQVLSLSADDATDCREILRYAMLVYYSCFHTCFVSF